MHIIMMALVATLLLGATAQAEIPSTSQRCIDAKKVRQHVVKKHGRRAPGRDICLYGVKGRAPSKIGRQTHPGYRAPTWQEKRDYLHQLRKLAAPALPYLIKSAAPPSQSPAGTLSATNAPAGLASCIVSRESGGNSQAVNGQYSGIAQWSQEAWTRMGGLVYASSPLGASYQEQLVVLSDGLSRYGCRDWCPWDGC